MYVYRRSVGMTIVDKDKQLDRICSSSIVDHPSECAADKYRTGSNGHCNNVNNALWGAAYEPFQRYLPPDYADGWLVFRLYCQRASLNTAQ